MTTETQTKTTKSTHTRGMTWNNKKQKLWNGHVISSSLHTGAKIWRNTYQRDHEELLLLTLVFEIFIMNILIIFVMRGGKKGRTHASRFT